MRVFDGYGFGQESEGRTSESEPGATIVPPPEEPGMPDEAKAQLPSEIAYKISVGNLKTGAPIAGALAKFNLRGADGKWNLIAYTKTNANGEATFVPSVSDVPKIDAAGPMNVSWTVSAKGYKDGMYILEDPQMHTTSIALEPTINLTIPIVAGVALVAGIVIYNVTKA